MELELWTSVLQQRGIVGDVELIAIKEKNSGQKSREKLQACLS